MGCASFTNGWYVTSVSGSSDFLYGNYYITHRGGNLWTCTGSFEANNSFSSGSITLSGGLDRVQLATSNGSDLFADAGTVNTSVPLTVVKFTLRNTPRVTLPAQYVIYVSDAKNSPTHVHTLLPTCVLVVK